jgi:NAD(P)-dependent dehydrogenase (short-subunit alcohol dehydrogenase family)
MERRRRYLLSGAGSGIGKAIAIQLASEGCDIILAGRNIEKLENTLKTLEKGNHLAIGTDVRNKQQCEEASQILSGTEIDGIIANAGVGGENHRGDDDRWDEIINTNLSGTYWLVNAFLPQLMASEAPKKHILVLSSLLARIGVKNHTAYCASKAGLLGLMRSWAVEFAPDNVMVNALNPGWVNTSMSREGMKAIADCMGITQDNLYQIAMKSVPLGRLAEPEEIAGLVSYLLTQKAISGQVLDINNGSSIIS